MHESYEFLKCCLTHRLRCQYRHTPQTSSIAYSIKTGLWMHYIWIGSTIIPEISVFRTLLSEYVWGLLAHLLRIVYMSRPMSSDVIKTLFSRPSRAETFDFRDRAETETFKQWWAESNRDSIQSRFQSPLRFDSQSWRFDSAGLWFDSDLIQNTSIRFKKQQIWPQISIFFYDKY